MISEMNYADAAAVRDSTTDRIAAAVARGDEPGLLDVDCYRLATARLDDLAQDRENALRQAGNPAS